MLTNTELTDIQSNNLYYEKLSIADRKLLYASPPTQKHIKIAYHILKGFNKNIKLSNIPSFDTYSDLQKWKLGMITKIIKES